MAIHCLRCGTELPETATFCFTCGKPQTEEGDTVEATRESTPLPPSQRSKGEALVDTTPRPARFRQISEIHQITEADEKEVQARLIAAGKVINAPDLQEAHPLGGSNSPSSFAAAEESGSARFPADDFRATAAAFSQVSGLLGGFSITILVLVLPKDFLQGQAAKDWIVGLLLLTAFLYVASASFLANSLNALVLKIIEARKRAFTFGIVLFHFANLLLGSTLAVLVYQFSFLVGLIAMILIGMVIIFVAFINFGSALGRLRFTQPNTRTPGQAGHTTKPPEISSI